MQQQTREVTGPSPSPSPVILGTCLLFAVTMCSSAGVAFDILTNTKGVPPFLAAFWRLFIQNVVQFFPFIWSLKQEWRRDEEKKILLYHQEALDLKVEVDSEEKRVLLVNELKDEDLQENQLLELHVLLLPRYLRSLPLCCISGVFLGIHFSM